MNETNKAMNDQFPDRLSVDPNSPYYNADILARDVGIRFKGVEKTNVEEYCISEGWVRVTAGNAKDRYGNPLTIKVHGPVEPYFRDKAGPDAILSSCRHCEERSDEAIHLSACDAMDCFASLAMTAFAGRQLTDHLSLKDAAILPSKLSFPNSRSQRTRSGSCSSKASTTAPCR